MGLLQAQATVGGVGDAGHRRQHHRGVDVDSAERETSVQDDFFFVFGADGVALAGGVTDPVHTIGETACNGR